MIWKQEKKEYSGMLRRESYKCWPSGVLVPTKEKLADILTFEKWKGSDVIHSNWEYLGWTMAQW